MGCAMNLFALGLAGALAGALLATCTLQQLPLPPKALDETEAKDTALPPPPDVFPPIDPWIPDTSKGVWKKPPNKENP